MKQERGRERFEFRGSLYHRKQEVFEACDRASPVHHCNNDKIKTSMRHLHHFLLRYKMLILKAQLDTHLPPCEFSYNSTCVLSIRPG